MRFTEPVGRWALHNSSDEALRGPEEQDGIIPYVPRTHTAKALANPAQPHSALLNELERYIEAHNPDVTDVNVVSATDTGQADKSHKPVRHWYHVTYEY